MEHLLKMSHLRMHTPLKHFKAFSSSFQPYNTHNMFVFYDTSFQKKIANQNKLVGLVLVVEIVAKYDREILLPLLLTMYN
jgi:hypothetical protein